MELIRKMAERKEIHPPEFVLTNTMSVVRTGSYAYGVSGPDSDVDLYGFCIPPKRFLFPHLSGLVHGFDAIPDFKSWHEELKKNSDDGKEYDFRIYNITHYFRLCVECNPNMVDCLFVPRDCVVHSTPVYELVRENRHLFLSQVLWPKFKGYAYSQLKKIENKKYEHSKRKDLLDKHGWDVKCGYHLCRLLLECEQLLSEGDLDLRRNKEVLKAIREGKWTLDRLKEFAVDKEKELESIKEKSELPKTPNYDAVRNLMMKCIEMHYGSIKDMGSSLNDYTAAISQVKKIVGRF